VETGLNRYLSRLTRYSSSYTRSGESAIFPQLEALAEGGDLSSYEHGRQVRIDIVLWPPAPSLAHSGLHSLLWDSSPLVKRRGSLRVRAFSRMLYSSSRTEMRPHFLEQVIASKNGQHTMVGELGHDEKDFVRLCRPAICIAKRIRSFALLECTYFQEYRDQLRGRTSGSLENGA
jgi:hypothetical protein